jgi:hypothetical protein
MIEFLEFTFAIIRFAVGVVVGFSVALGKGLLGLVGWAFKSHKQMKEISRPLECPRGCEAMPADGVQTCTKCKAQFDGWVWQPCPVCEHQARFVPCETCGHAIKNPVWEDPKLLALAR